VVWRLLTYGASARIMEQHIRYDIPFPRTFTIPVNIMYLCATVLPPFASGVRGMKVLGGIILTSFIVTMVFYSDYLISVWCFFAALLSVVVIAVMWMLHGKRGSPERGQLSR
jgi:hypothetical protein